MQDIHAPESIFYRVFMYGKLQRKVDWSNGCLAWVSECISGKEQADLTQIDEVVIFSYFLPYVCSSDFNLV